MLSEQSSCAVAIRVHHIHEWISVLAQAGGVDNYFEVFCHLLKKNINSRAFENVNVAYASIDVHGDRVVLLLHLVELAVNEGLIEVEHESFAALAMFRLRTDQAFRNCFLV